MRQKPTLVMHLFWKIWYSNGTSFINAHDCTQSVTLLFSYGVAVDLILSFPLQYFILLFGVVVYYCLWPKGDRFGLLYTKFLFKT